jgi:hypothetical protein
MTNELHEALERFSKLPDDAILPARVFELTVVVHRIPPGSIWKANRQTIRSALI